MSVATCLGEEEKLVTGDIRIQGRSLGNKSRPLDLLQKLQQQVTFRKNLLIGKSLFALNIRR